MAVSSLHSDISLSTSSDSFCLLHCMEYERYIQEVEQSGIPRWVYDHYYNSFPQLDDIHVGDVEKNSPGDLPF
jgi:hypothetical protein